MWKHMYKIEWPQLLI